MNYIDGMVRLRYDLIAGNAPFFAAVTDSKRFPSAVGLHTHDFDEALLVTHGEVRHELNGTTSILEAGTLCWIQAADTHRFLSMRGSQFRFINVAFPSESLGTLLAEFSLDPAGVRQNARVATFEAFESMLRETPTSIKLLRFLSDVLQELSEPDRTPGSWLQNSVDQLKSDRGLREGLAGLHRSSGVSLPHLCRSVRQQYGVTASALINSRRLSRATELLRTSDHDLNAIAEQVGFGSASYFSRLFEREYGLSPGRFRRQQSSFLAPLIAHPNRTQD